MSMVQSFQRVALSLTAALIFSTVAVLAATPVIPIA